MGSLWKRSYWSEKKVAGSHQQHRRIFKLRSTLMNHSFLYVTLFEVFIWISLLSCFENEKDLHWELHHAKMVVEWGFWERVPADVGRYLLLRIFSPRYELNFDDVLHKHNKEIYLPRWRPAGTLVFYPKELKNNWEYPVWIRTWRWTYHLHEWRKKFRWFLRLRSHHPLTKTSLNHFKYSQSTRPVETPRMYRGRLLKAIPISGR